MESPEWTHQRYFRQFRLNVEQYGEILVAAAFEGDKLGDAQPCFDIRASKKAVHGALVSGAVAADQSTACLGEALELRIEVKSKLSWTGTGRANVIHCRNKFESVRGQPPATHLAFLLFDGAKTGMATHAYLLSCDAAMSLRRMDTKSQYIPVPAVCRAGAAAMPGIVDITALINGVAQRPLRHLSASLAVT